MIYCVENSECHVNIRNSTFDKNIGGFYGNDSIINGIVLADNANGEITINSSIFFGAGNPNHTIQSLNGVMIYLSLKIQLRRQQPCQLSHQPYPLPYQP